MAKSYENAGVNLEAGYEVVRRIKQHVASTSRKGSMGGIGSFGGMFDLASLGYKEPVLVSGTDGVGTKLKIAFAMDRHDTVGIDAVAMCVNDVLAQGAEPLFFLDYVAVGRNIPAQIRKLKFRCEPGTEYNYDSMTSEVLGFIIERAVGMSYAEYLCEKIWIPLGMESPAYMNYDSKKHHTAHAFGGLALTMRDLAKIGRLYLNRGVWEGKRIVRESWIEQSTAYSQENEGYHFCWYNTSCIGADKPEFPGYYAMGIRGQVLYVNPYKNLIMVRLGLKDDTYAHIPYLFEQLSILWPTE